MPKLFTIADLSRLLVLLEIKFPVDRSVAWASAYSPIDFFNQVVRATLDLVMNALLALQKLPYLASTVAPFMETTIVSLPDQYIF